MTHDTAQSFSSEVYTALMGTPIFGLLSKSDAVVLERIAFGAGCTNWYYCQGQSQLRDIAEQLSPGSVVSFYFDRRVECSFYSPSLESVVERIIAETREAIVGFLRADGFHIDIEVITGKDELNALTSGAAPTSRMFYGVFPARENDGIRAVTVTLPDKDGVVRSHPH
jgi:hypothetical protein